MGDTLGTKRQALRMRLLPSDDTEKIGDLAILRFLSIQYRNFRPGSWPTLCQHQNDRVQRSNGLGVFSGSYGEARGDCGTPRDCHNGKPSQLQIIAESLHVADVRIDAQTRGIG